jgi:hypothetical protein
MGTEEEFGIFQRHNLIWGKSYGRQWLVGVVGFVVALVGALALMRSTTGGGASVMVLGAIVALGAILLSRAYQANLRSVTAEELSNLIPVLDLTDHQRIYAETIVALSRLQGAKSANSSEVVQQLNALLDQSLMLDAAKAKLTQAGVHGRMQPIVEERNRLRDQFEAAADPVARETIRRSLEICESRLAGANKYSARLERIDAQQEMIRQTMLGVKESSHRIDLSSDAMDALDLSDLRMRVHEVHRDSKAIEDAVLELDAGR